MQVTTQLRQAFANVPFLQFGGLSVDKRHWKVQIIYGKKKKYEKQMPFFLFFYPFHHTFLTIIHTLAHTSI